MEAAQRTDELRSVALTNAHDVLGQRISDAPLPAGAAQVMAPRLLLESAADRVEPFPARRRGQNRCDRALHAELHSHSQVVEAETR